MTINVGRMLGMSKLPVETWMTYVEAFIDQLPLRDCMNKCGVGLRTAWFMRRRIIECIQRYNPSFNAVAGNHVEIDATHFRDSYKDYRKGTMPRPARKSGKKAAKRGLSKQQVCVVTGIYDAGTSFLVVSGRCMLDKERTYKAPAGHISKGALVVTDKAGAYPAILERLGATLERTDTTEHAINRINSLNGRLKDFMHGFKGMSTKHLQSCLAWFQWTEAFKSAPTEQRGTIEH